MLDDDPDFKWSNAWWGKILFGIVGSSAMALGGVAALVTGKAYAVGFGQGMGGWRRGRLDLIVVEGFAAQLMALAYFGAALALFAYAYARNNEKLNPFANALLVLGLLAALLGTGWCAWLLLAL